ncbi:MAG: YraN family protein [Candidatus Omnitrophica bacterium]|nr:YraN family protein [Candidatus Omnitrophota bacterium]MDD5237173.1 YraN family protein [Candidatus Omnitrophota bacterium]MDD5610886.1 YraN family protein [Candidatus Omnitrophota bacterium]
MPKNNLFLARSGEDLALDFLKTKKYKILERNYRSPLGELDIIALDKDTVCFIEVKTRTSDRFGLPSEAVVRAKQRKISQAALVYLKKKGLLNKKARFDVVSIMHPDEQAKIDLVKNAFELDTTYSY